jgi:micrococcal nuclease
MKDSLYNYEANVVRVVDGDTIIVDIDLGFSLTLKNQSLRLARVNAPELKGSSREAGEKTRDALIQRISNQKIQIKTHKVEKDKYGRILADVFLQGHCINDWLLLEGYAAPYASQGV